MRSLIRKRVFAATNRRASVSPRRGVLALIAVVLIVTAFALSAMPGGAHEPIASRSVLVFGGAGRLGAEIVRELVGEGHEVTVFLRPSSTRARLEGLPVTLIEGDARVEADVRRAFESKRFNVVVNALGRSESDASFFAITGQHIARAARATGVGHVILHSSVGVGASRAVYPAERLGSMSEVFRAKEVAERELIDSGVTWTIIRNAILRDLPPGVRDGARLLPGETGYGVVSRTGLARLTRECIGNEACRNRIFHAVDAGLTPPRPAS
jgi:uncharacterized protein YbjT (DUF2867 family)